jgi:hypothetical protein
MSRSRLPSQSDAETVPSEKHAPVLAPGARYGVGVVAGPDVGASLLVDGTEPSPSLVGQSSACALRLSDRQVSRRHVTLEIVERRLHLVDLGSTNGTRVNGLAVSDAHLTGGETIAIGDTVLRVDRLDSATAIAIPVATSFGRVLGTSAEMRRLYPLCERIAASTVAVILEGETGTGKELLAESIHEMGPRASGPFVVFDCTATPPNLVESDLFGHERGAFTGAISTRKGVFELAHGGTLLVDEIGDLDLALQPKLLRALERSEIRRVGGDHPIRVDVRVLAATRRDLDREVQAGGFATICSIGFRWGGSSCRRFVDVEGISRCSRGGSRTSSAVRPRCSRTTSSSVGRTTRGLATSASSGTRSRVTWRSATSGRMRA